MKRLLFLLLLLLPFSGNSLTRYNTPPALHSIFDAPRRPLQVMDIRLATLAQASAAPFRNSSEKVAEGITFLVFAAVCFGMTGYFAYKDDKDSQAAKQAGKPYGNGVVNLLLEGFFTVLGAAFLTPGLILTIKYSRNGGGGNKRFW